MEAEFFIWNSSPVDSRHCREAHGVQQVQVWSRVLSRLLAKLSRRADEKRGKHVTSSPQLEIVPLGGGSCTLPIHLFAVSGQEWPSRKMESVFSCCARFPESVSLVGDGRGSFHRQWGCFPQRPRVCGLAGGGAKEHSSGDKLKLLGISKRVTGIYARCSSRALGLSPPSIA
jgi:hypothetical protein